MDSGQLPPGGFDDANALSPVEFKSSISTGSRAPTADRAILIAVHMTEKYLLAVCDCAVFLKLFFQHIQFGSKLVILVLIWLIFIPSVALNCLLFL